MSGFTARYDGRCANECGIPIRQGDTVEYVDDELVHVGCKHREYAPADICGKCFMAKSSTGKCGCPE